MEFLANARAARMRPAAHAEPQANTRAFMGRLLLVLTVAVAVRAYQPTGWLGSDDAAYYSAAEHILTGTPIARPHHHYARTSIILPVAASLAVFGHHTWAVALPTFLASLACVMLVVVLGRQLLGWREGLLAGLIVAVLPYFRVLSTTAYPDTHVCLWATASVSFCVFSLRSGRKWPLYCSGIALGLAISSKVFAAVVWVALAVFLLQTHKRNLQKVMAGTALILLGWLTYFLAEGFFFSRWTGDFLFAVHAHQKSQTGVPGMAPESAASVVGLATLIRERMSLMWQTNTSGWGLLGLAFWPAIAFGLLHRAMRPMAAWAAATYLLIAFCPVSLASGYQPYPHFHGRHILAACVPFSLCLAALTSMALGHTGRLFAPRDQLFKRDRIGVLPASAWVVVAIGIVAAAFSNHRELKGFRDRPTGRTGDAVRLLAAQDIWPPEKLIFLTPSTYWRYRILFPQQLQFRLRVAVAHDAPDWWRHVAPGIEVRHERLPLPGKAIVVGTPTQLEGKPESWDYGVAFPESILEWKSEQGMAVRLDQTMLVGLYDELEGTEPLLIASGAGLRPHASMVDKKVHKGPSAIVHNAP